MRLLIAVAVVIGVASGVNVPTSSHSSHSFVTYHGHAPPQPQPQPKQHIQSHSSPNYQRSSTYYGSIFTAPQTYYSATPAPVPSQMCPAMPPPCVKSRYRTLDGTCNNLQNPMWGSANNRYGRLLTPRYGDGVSTPTTSITGQDLPSSRLVSLVVFGEADVPDPQFTLANMQWGQIMTHDMSMQAGGTQSRRHGTRCCTDDGKLISTGQHNTCFPIIVPKNDPAHSQTNTECLNFVRTLTDRDNNCKGATDLNRPAEQLTTVTAYLDLSLVYGNSEQQNRPIRAFSGGRMLVENRAGNEWPPQDPNATASCDVQTPQETCYLAGDSRMNQNPGLTILQIVLLREHNRIADTLQGINPAWDDETVFQEARRINIAQYQHISYYEWLPIFLGRENMLKNRLIYQTTKGSFINDYNPNIDPSVLNSHATAAFRYFHSQIEGRLE
jgi:peroxidase